MTSEDKKQEEKIQIREELEIGHCSSCGGYLRYKLNLKLDGKFQVKLTCADCEKEMRILPLSKDRVEYLNEKLAWGWELKLTHKDKMKFGKINEL